VQLIIKYRDSLDQNFIPYREVSDRGTRLCEGLQHDVHGGGGDDHGVGEILLSGSSPLQKYLLQVPYELSRQFHQRQGLKHGKARLQQATLLDSLGLPSHFPGVRQSMSSCDFQQQVAKVKPLVFLLAM
jgi:hypothetical protein